MSDMSDYLEDRILENVLNNSTNPGVANLYVALFTVAPDDADAGGTEVPLTNNYGRATIAAGGWTVAGLATRAENTAPITFAQTGAGGWGTVIHVGIYDALTGGNLMFHRALTTNRTILEDDVFQFAATDLGITLT